MEKKKTKLTISFMKRKLKEYDELQTEIKKDKIKNTIHKL